jgi:hypothetical protein
VDRIREWARLAEFQGGVRHSVNSRRPSYAEPQPIDAVLVDRDQFANVVAALSGPGPLRIAIRRFNVADEPRIETDALLDLWIAMEALFSPDDGREVTFRLAQNAANFIDRSDVARRTLFNWIKKGYDLRSSLVHGREAKLSRLTRLDGSRVTTLAEAIADLRSIVRDAVTKALREGPPDPNGPALRP